MFSIPIKVLQNSSTKKNAIKQNNSIVFGDKIVNKLTEPTLYNVQNAAQAMQANTNTSNIRVQRRSNLVILDQVKLSNDTLLEMNIALDPTKKDFSLLQQNPEISRDINPNIMDMELIDNIENTPTSVNNYFPPHDGPILELDDINTTRVGVNELQRDGTLSAPVDLSKILCDLHILNMNDSYFGKNKYYK